MNGIRKWLRLILLAAAVVIAPHRVQAAFELGDIICETTATTGTGTINLAGAVSNYATFVSQITSGATVPYNIVSGDDKIETGIGTFTDATPDTLSRTANWSTDGSGAELTLSGTSRVCLGPGEQIWTGGVLTPWFLGIDLGDASDTELVRTAAGEATIAGDAIKHAGKQMMWISAGAMKGNVTSPASCGDTYDSGTNDLTISVCAFDTGATEERVDFQVAMPKSWNEGTVTAIPISTSTGITVGQTIQYEIACVAISGGDTLNATMGSAQTSLHTAPSSPGNLLAVGAETSAITCAGTPAENDYVAFRISRDTSVDTATGDALLLGIKLFWTDNASTMAE